MNYEQTLTQLALADERIVVMTAENRAAIRTIDKSLHERFIDVGICEQTLVGTAAGLALRGRKPVVHALAPFLTMRAFEFIRTDVAFPHLPVKLVGSIAGFLSDANGPTHQAVEDVALMKSIPGMHIFAPADEQDLLLGLPHVLSDDNPWYIRFNSSPAAVDHHPFELGKAEVLTEGSDVAILTYGLLLAEAMRAEEILRSNGVSARVVNLRTLNPLDEETIVQAAKDAGLLVTIEDHFQSGGLYSIVAELMFDRRLLPEVMPINLGNRWFKPALLRDTLQHEGFTGDQIARRILERLQSHNPPSATISVPSPEIVSEVDINA